MQETLHRVFTHSLYMFRRDKSNLKLLPDLVFSGEWQHSPGKIGDEKKERKLIDRNPLFSSAVPTWFSLFGENEPRAFAIKQRDRDFSFRSASLAVGARKRVSIANREDDVCWQISWRWRGRAANWASTYTDGQQTLCKFLKFWPVPVLL